MTNRIGQHTILLPNRPRLAASAAIVGKKEGAGPLRDDFDQIIEDDLFGEETWEKAESRFQYTAADLAIRRAGLTHEQIDAALQSWIDFSVKAGVSAVFDAGWPEGEELHERVYEHLRDMDEKGKLPVYIDGSYALTHPKKMMEVVEQVKRFRREETVDAKTL